MPANERQRVAAARVGEGDAGVARRRQPGRHAGHDLERDTLLVEEQRLGAAAVEQERIAPLQARHDLALARLLGEQVADRFLRDRLRRRDAEVDFLGVGARVAQHSRRDEMVVQHHVRRFEALQPANGDEPGITGTRAN